MKTEIIHSIQSAFLGVILAPFLLLVAVVLAVQIVWELLKLERPLDPLAPLHNPYEYE